LNDTIKTCWERNPERKKKQKNKVFNNYLLFTDYTAQCTYCSTGTVRKYAHILYMYMYIKVYVGIYTPTLTKISKEAMTYD
jgi:hypothetical protein